MAMARRAARRECLRWQPAGGDAGSPCSGSRGGSDGRDAASSRWLSQGGEFFRPKRIYSPLRGDVNGSSQGNGDGGANGFTRRNGEAEDLFERNSPFLRCSV